MTKAQQFETFMQTYQDMVFSTALRLVANATEAEDIAQEVFLRAYQRFGDLRDEPRAGGWLKKVTVNLSLNHLSRYRSRWTFFTDFFHPERDNEEMEVEFAAPTDTEAEVSALERHAVVDKALRNLPTAQRVPLVLFHVEGLKYEEIAERLGISMGKVKTDIFRGREALRQKLGKILNE